MHVPASGIRRICIPGTSVNRVASVSAIGRMYQEQSKQMDALVYKGTGIFRARERKDNIVGTIAEPRKGAVWMAILRAG
jgi:hypothetical protein